MKCLAFLLVVISFSTILVACSSQDIANTWQREKYRAEIETQLDKLNKQIEELSIEVEKWGPEAAADLEQTINELETQRLNSSELVEQLNSAAADSWENLKPEIDQAIDELNQSYKKAYQEVMEARIEQLEKQIAKLRAEAEWTSLTPAPDLAEALNELEAQRQVANQRLEELRATSLETWKDFQPEVETALNELEEVYQQVLSQLEERS